jgi:hypothetical protein
MGFTNDEEGGSDGRMPPIVATIVDIGVDYRDYGDDNKESRLIVIWKPGNDVFGVQTEILSNSGLLKVESDARVIRVGGAERGFDIEIIGNVILSGKLGYKAALWMTKLKALGVKTPEDSGDLKELIGVKAAIKQLTYSEAKGRPKKDSEKVFWVPTEICSMPQEEEPDQKNTTKVPEDRKPTLEEDIQANAEGKTESGLVEWYEGSRHYDGKSVVPLFIALSEITGQGAIKLVGDAYTAGIREPIAARAAEGFSDDLGPIEEEGAHSSSKPAGGS